MTEQELFDHLNAWENIELIAAEMLNDPRQFNTLMNLALNNTHERSWRAAYLIDKIHDKNPELVQPYLPVITEKLKTEKSDSKCRHWLKLISMNKIENDLIVFLFDYCIKTFISGNAPVAVRVHAMQILFNISEMEPDFKSEVLELIEHEIEYHPTAGIRARGRKLVARLHKQLQQMSS